MVQSAPQPQHFPFFSKLRSYLELMRPANIVTSFADILAGFATAGAIMVIEQSTPNVAPSGLGWLLFSTFGLYGGGVVFNDVFDADLDSRERPGRAIPSGRTSQTGAALVGTFLLLLGILSAFQVTAYSGVLAIAIAICALAYDAWAKHSAFWGPLLMGLCRGGNLLLGCSIFPEALSRVWYLAFFPIAYIASVTLISQGEVHGGNKTSGAGALVFIILVIAGLLLLGLLPFYNVKTALPFVIFFGLMVIPPFLKAARSPEAGLIRKAVKRGVLSLVILNSAIAGGVAGILSGAVILLLLPISLLLAWFFKVT